MQASRTSTPSFRPDGAGTSNMTAALERRELGRHATCFPINEQQEGHSCKVRGDLKLVLCSLQKARGPANKTVRVVRPSEESG